MKSRITMATTLFLVLALSVSAFSAGPLLFDKTEYAARRAKLMEKIPDGVAILLGATPPTGGEFFQNNDMMYFAGVEIPNAALLIDGRSKTTTLFFTITDSGARNEGISLDLVHNAAAVTGIEGVSAIDQFTPTLSRLAGSGAVLYTSFKPEELSREYSAEKLTKLQNSMTLNLWDGRLTRELQFVTILRERFPQAVVKDAAPFIWDLRSIKSPAEIAHLRKVGRLGVEAHRAMMRATRVGVPEYEMSAAFEYAVKKAGARDLAYNVIISSAENHPYLHYYRHDRILKDGDFIVVDAGPNLDYYVVDISASYPANGRFTPRQREIYEAALAIEEACKEVYRPGIEAKDVQPLVLAILKKKGFNIDKDLFKIRTMQTGISHNVGMATHDVSPGPRGPLRAGMVFACDIYAVFPGEDLGVRVEDTIVITDTGSENLTPGLPRTIAEIEALMKDGARPDDGAAAGPAKMSSIQATPASAITAAGADGASAVGSSPAAGRQTQPARPPIVVPVIMAPAGSQAVEQVAQGTRPGATVVASFDGLGHGFEGPQGSATVRNPSDNSLAVGPDHIVQTVNSRMAIFTKKGRQFGETGRALYGPVATNNVFRGFGGMCETTNNGDAVVRYDQLASRWVIVMPIFRRGAARPDQPGEWKGGDTVYISPPGRPGQPGPAVELFQPPLPPPALPGQAGQPGAPPAARPGRGTGEDAPQGPYSMCYAVSTGTDPFGPYYRYEFLRPLFPDYPRPAIWPDGYYVPTSTGDNPISESIATQKHACVADRARMLKGEPATEQCVVMNDVGFLNNADVDGTAPPPPGAPNIMMAAGGMQLNKRFEADTIGVWEFHVDWKTPANTKVTGPQQVAVAPYHYLCDGQLTHCVPQPGTESRLDAQGDKIMSRLVYRRIGARESIVAVHSVNTTAGGGGVRWYEFVVGRDRRVSLHQQGTYAPDGFFRWMASPAIDAKGNIAIGYSFGGTPNFAGQRVAGRLASDPPGRLTLRETVLVAGEGVQNAMRWEDYTQTAMDPADDRSIWYVGDYIKQGGTAYSTRIVAFRLQ